MKSLNLDLDLSFITGDKPKIKDIWDNFLINGSRAAYKDGVDLKMQSKLVKILDKLKDEGTIELEDAEFDVLKDIKERAKFDPNYARLGSRILQKLEEAK